MNKTLRTRVHLKVSKLQLPLHKNYTSEFLNREDNSRDLLGKHWQDKTVPDRSKRRLLQSIGHQFPCAKLLKLWGLRDSDECRLCKRLHPEVTPWPESICHIQARCLALQKPRIAVHHGIWRELLTAISRNSVQSHENGNRKWYFPSAVSEATHDEWTVRQILVHLGLFSEIKSPRADVTEFHAQQVIVLTDVEITSFYSRRPDGAAFDDKNKLCVFLEFTRPMDSVTSSPEGDWAKRKELEKNARYGMHIYFIDHLSALHGRPWNCTQANFTVGARGSLKQTQLQDRLLLLEVTNSKARDKIRALTVSKTLALLDIILKLFHVSILRSPDWSLSSLPTELVTSQLANVSIQTLQKNYRPIQWAGNLRSRIIRPLSPGETGPFKGPQPTLTAPLSLAHTWVEQSHQALLICLCVCVCVYVYVCIYICICICVCMYMCMCLNICICTYVYVYVWVCICVVYVYGYLYMYMCVYMCMCVYTYICVCVCEVYMYIYMYRCMYV